MYEIKEEILVNFENRKVKLKNLCSYYDKCIEILKNRLHVSVVSVKTKKGIYYD